MNEIKKFKYTKYPQFSK